jgi:hypothetical protein
MVGSLFAWDDAARGRVAVRPAHNDPETATLLTISTTHRPATYLAYLLHKNTPISVVSARSTTSGPPAK